ncbi:MAG: hypothetical protein ACOC93_03590 [Planctomycetota bacterium]
MTDTGNNEQLLIDYLTGACDEQQRRDVERRLDDDREFARLHRDLQATFQAMDLLPEFQPPKDLAIQTLRRIRSARQTDQLLAREQMGRPRTYWPTFRVREGVAVAASILILASIFIPSLRMASQRANQAACQSRIGQVGQGLQAYAAEHDGKLPAHAGNGRWLPAEGAEFASNTAGLFQLIPQGYARPIWFQCPAVGGQSFTVRSGMADFPGREYIHYSYQHMLGKGLRIDQFPDDRVRERMAIFADGNPLYENGEFQARSPRQVAQATSKNHGGEGQNVLYLDMHTEWTRKPTVGVDNDNIYTAADVYDYRGVEQPRSPTDSFLLPALPRQAR